MRIFLTTILSLFAFLTLEAKNAYSVPRISSKSSYQQKRAYEGFGKKSSVTGQFKTKITSGHSKRTKNGLKFVQPYARSK